MVGLIEGVGEATASISKLFSGWLSDRLGKRKMLTVVGYGLAALSKPLFALAPTTGLGAVRALLGSCRQGHSRRAARRAGRRSRAARTARRGIRIAAIARYRRRLCRASIGLALMAIFADNFRLVFWVSLDPGRDRRRHSRSGRSRAVRCRRTRGPRAAPIDWRELKHLGGAFWGVVAVGSVLTLARFSEAFLILRARRASGCH